jgi:hypothetical protein
MQKNRVSRWRHTSRILILSGDNAPGVEPGADHDQTSGKGGDSGKREYLFFLSTAG